MLLIKGVSDLTHCSSMCPFSLVIRVVSSTCSRELRLSLLRMRMVVELGFAWSPSFRKLTSSNRTFGFLTLLSFWIMVLGQTIELDKEGKKKQVFQENHVFLHHAMEVYIKYHFFDHLIAVGLCRETFSHRHPDLLLRADLFRDLSTWC